MKFWAQPKKLYKILHRAYSVVTDRARYDDRTGIPNNTVDILKIEVSPSHRLKVSTVFKKIRLYSNTVDDLIVTENQGEAYVIDCLSNFLSVLNASKKDWICVYIDSLGQSYVDDFCLESYPTAPYKIEPIDAKLLQFSDTSGYGYTVNSKTLLNELQAHKAIPVRSTYKMLDERRHWVIGCLIRLKPDYVEFVSTDATMIYQSTITAQTHDRNFDDSYIIPIHSIEQATKFLSTLRDETVICFEKFDENRVFSLRSGTERYKVLLQKKNSENTPLSERSVTKMLNINDHIEIPIKPFDLREILSEFKTYATLNKDYVEVLNLFFKSGAKLIFKNKLNQNVRFHRELPLDTNLKFKSFRAKILKSRINIILKLTKNATDLKLYAVPKNKPNDKPLTFKIDDKYFIIAQARGVRN
jgi:hypothetical protein